jgi:pimeloyl-ACP methyl ester carboxylesterase
MEGLAPRFRVLAPDLYDSGQGPRWPSDRVIRLRDEVALIDPVLETAGSPVALVGHSYGAAVALIAALAAPGRVCAMALFEPTLFALLDPETNEAEEIRRVLAEACIALDAGDREAAAEQFIDYWMGTRAWKRAPERNKQPITDSVRNLRRWAHALFTEDTPLEAFRSLDLPVLYMVGRRSPASSQAVARLLAAALPQVEVVEFQDIGHMGPVTHADVVNDAIGRFLERTVCFPQRPQSVRRRRDRLSAD